MPTVHACLTDPALRADLRAACLLEALVAEAYAAERAAQQQAARNTGCGLFGDPAHLGRAGGFQLAALVMEDVGLRGGTVEALPRALAEAIDAEIADAQGDRQSRPGYRNAQLAALRAAALRVALVAGLHAVRTRAEAADTADARALAALVR